MEGSGICAEESGKKKTGNAKGKLHKNSVCFQKV